MAVTVVSSQMVAGSVFPACEIELSGLTAAASETVSFPSLGRPSGAALKRLALRVKTAATSGSPVILGAWASDESNNQFTVRFETTSGGDLAGAVVVLHGEWDSHASGGQS